MERGKEIILQNAVMENALLYLYNKLKRIHHANFDETYTDGTIHYYSLYVYPINSNKIEVEYSISISPKGDIQKAYGMWNMFPAMSFEAQQLQTTTVLIKGECKHRFFESIFNQYWDDMLKAFDAAPPASTDNRSSQIRSNYDPPHYERIVPGTVDKVIKFINDFVKNDGIDLQLKYAYQGKGYFFDTIKKQSGGQYVVFVSKYDENQKRDPVGDVIHFEFVEGANRVKVRGDCYYDDAAVIEYFNILWDEFTKLFPAMQDMGQVPAGAVRPEKPKQKGRYRLTESDIRFRRQKVKEANKVKRDNPQKQWKEIDKQFAEELKISNRTFRSWRHNNY